MNNPAEIVKKVYAINVSVRVSGRTTKKSKPVVTTTGETIEREYDVEERIENADQYKAASALATRLRELPSRYGSTIDGAIPGFITSPENAEKFRAAYERVLAIEVAQHNAVVNQTAIVEPSVYVGAIGLTFGPDDAKQVLDFIARELLAQRDALTAGNTEAVTNWLKRGQYLGAMLPGLNATVIAGAIESIREAKNTIAARIRTHFADADAYKATKNKPLENVEILRDALQCVEWDRACDQVEAALGWLQPAPSTNASEVA